VLLHFDGATVDGHEVDIFDDDIEAIAGSGPNDVWFAGYGRVLHYDTGTFRVLGTGRSELHHDLWSPAPRGVWAPVVGGVANFDAGQSKASFGLLASGAPLRVLWGRTPKELYFGGVQGQLWTSNGAALSSPYETETELGSKEPVRAIWGDGKGSVWAVVRDHVFWHQGSAWAKHYEDADPPEPNRRVFFDLGSAGEGVYVAASGQPLSLRPRDGPLAACGVIQLCDLPRAGHLR
jgi:hypothetical protein